MSDERLVELLVEWEERRKEGRLVTAVELCPDDPALCDLLQARIDRRQRFAPILEPDAGATIPVATTRLSPDIPHVAGYEILDVIGHGGMGIVYKAKQLGLNRLVALKMILTGQAATATERARFLTEAQAVAHLAHPNIVQVFEVGQTGSHAYLAMEYLTEGSLASRLDDRGLDPKFAAELLLPLADAVAHAHAHGIVHRDLKPANILLAPRVSEANTNTGRIGIPFVPKVADFGLAKRLDAEQGYTQTGAVLGSPSYMPPEQAIGATDIGPAADVYGLGAVLYELLTGRPPFRGASFVETLDMVRHSEVIPPRQFRALIPRDLEVICLKCLHKDPARRYPTASELVADLQCYLAGEQISAKADGLGSQIVRLFGHTDLDHRAADFARTVVWLAPLGIGTQTIAYLGWHSSVYYPQIVLGSLLICLAIMITVLLGTNQNWVRELPTSQRRHHRTTWISNFVACALIIFVISWTIKPDHPSELMVMIPLMVTLTGTSILSAASFAGWMYISGYVFYATAILMTLDLSLAGLELGVLMTANVLYQSWCMRRLDRSDRNSTTTLIQR